MSILKSRFSHVIFDWDGTLMDSTGRIVSAMQSTARNLAMDVPSEEMVKSIIGLSMQAVLDKVFPKACEKTRTKILEEYRYQYVEGDTTPTPLFEGSLTLLNWLREQGVIVSVATGKARNGLDRVMNEVGLLNFFDSTICADEARSKPEPQMVEVLIAQSQRPKTEVIVIGDSVHDLRMAKNAGVAAIGVTSGANDLHTLQSLKPLAVLERVCLLKDWFES